ncbi:hypothetical protein NP233_g7456 [Leucocoprinus birnbaumii]|uniref:Uncharacterized protein n=1 Tax=Leucocoprinus birnbaumii TaxID=56174 RepID=A0AAD5VRU9_9AGAR|nr:hypothetical protein NP233_g7456 [Leucocoprinus birnbaumii]
MTTVPPQSQNSDAPSHARRFLLPSSLARLKLNRRTSIHEQRVEIVYYHEVKFLANEDPLIGVVSLDEGYLFYSDNEEFCRWTDFPLYWLEIFDMQRRRFVPIMEETAIYVDCFRRPRLLIRKEGLDNRSCPQVQKHIRDLWDDDKEQDSDHSRKEVAPLDAEMDDDDFVPDEGSEEGEKEEDCGGCDEGCDDCFEDAEACDVEMSESYEIILQETEISEATHQLQATTTRGSSQLASAEVNPIPATPPFTPLPLFFDSPSAPTTGHSVYPSTPPLSNVPLSNNIREYFEFLQRNPDENPFIIRRDPSPPILPSFLGNELVAATPEPDVVRRRSLSCVSTTAVVGSSSSFGNVLVPGTPGSTLPSNPPSPKIVYEKGQYHYDLTYLD